MNYVLLLTLSFSLPLLWSTQAVRVSPKLDFGESRQDRQISSAGIRPAFEPRYRQDSGYRRVTDSTTSNNLEVSCISGNCTASNVKTDSDGGISADVLVHIKTNVDVAKSKNITTEATPDVPIIVGSKSSTFPTIDNNVPIGIPNSIIPSDISGINTILPTSNGFLPSSRPAFFQHTGLQSDSQTRDFTGNNNYAPRFQGNGIDFQVNSFVYPTNNNVNRQVPQQHWYPKRSGSGVYNPVEFRKTYTNVWAPVTWSGGSSSDNDRRTSVGIPRWTPCLCPNQGDHNLAAGQNYPPPNHPAGINGKLGSLV